MNRIDFLKKGIELTDSTRSVTHGDWVENHKTIAEFWTVYLSNKLNAPIHVDHRDVSMMMALLKTARHLNGSYNEDDYIDGAVYFAGAGELNMTGFEDNEKSINLLKEYGIITDYGTVESDNDTFIANVIKLGMELAMAKGESDKAVQGG